VSYADEHGRERVGPVRRRERVTHPVPNQRSIQRSKEGVYGLGTKTVENVRAAMVEFIELHNRLWLDEFFVSKNQTDPYL